MKIISFLLIVSTILLGIFVWREFSASKLVSLSEESLSDQFLKWIGVGTAAVNLLILAKNGLFSKS